MTLIVADFNLMDEQGRIWLPDAERANVRRGERVLLTDGEVELEATLGYDFGRHVWLGLPDRQTIRAVESAPAVPSSSR